MLAHKYKKNSFCKSTGEEEVFSCFPTFSFEIAHLCSAQVFLTPGTLPLPVSLLYQSPLKPRPRDMYWWVSVKAMFSVLCRITLETKERNT